MGSVSVFTVSISVCLLVLCACVFILRFAKLKQTDSVLEQLCLCFISILMHLIVRGVRLGGPSF